MPAPIYTPENCRAAYQLNWALSLFWHEPPGGCEWLAELSVAAEPDGVRILKHHFVKPNVSQFLSSTRPDLAPDRMIWSVKGRLQHAVSGNGRRRFAATMVSAASVPRRARKSSDTSARRLPHHPLADPRVMETLQTVQIDDPSVDLSAARQNAHALYWYNLHVCFVADGRCMEVRREPLMAMGEMIVRRRRNMGTSLQRRHLARSRSLGAGLRRDGTAR